MAILFEIPFLLTSPSLVVIFAEVTQQSLQVGYKI